MYCGTCGEFWPDHHHQEHQCPSEEQKAIEPSEPAADPAVDQVIDPATDPSPANDPAPTIIEKQDEPIKMLRCGSC